MKIALYSPWKNAWVPLYREAFQSRGHEFQHSANGAIEGADVYLHGWADGRNPVVPGAKNIVFLRRYELYDAPWTKTDWANVSALVCVNDAIADLVRGYFKEGGIKVPVHVVYNAIDTKDWKFRQRAPNKKVGMACFIHAKKNLPLAMQVLAELPNDYSLHIAGENQDQWVMDYIHTFAAAVRRNVVLYGQIDYDQMDLWWDQMGACLSTSYSEGNPNNVIQAMAKGIKPVVHIWPGAMEQFPEEFLFATASEAAHMIQSDAYDSESYRRLAVDRFGLANIERVVEMALQ